MHSVREINKFHNYNQAINAWSSSVKVYEAMYENNSPTDCYGFIEQKALQWHRNTPSKENENLEIFEGTWICEYATQLI